MNVSALQLWGFEGRHAPNDLLERAARGEVTGVSLFRHFNVDSPTQVNDLTSSLAEAAGVDNLLIAVDQEGGQLRALAGSTPFAGNLALGAVDDVDLTRRVAAAIGRELRAVGVTVNYAPVADVLTRADNPALGVRTFGSDPETVGRHVSAFVTGLRQASVLSVVKHFPGAGEAVVDPHHGLPVLNMDEARLDEVELVPFEYGFKAAADAVMIGHYALPELTGRPDLPSSVSEEIIGQLLRRRLGFDGLVVTDALDMRALAQGRTAVLEAVAALRAGTDLLLSTADYERSVNLDEGLVHAVSRGFLDCTAVNRSMARIAAARELIGGSEQPDLSVVGGHEHQQLADELARRSITLVRSDDGALPISPKHRLVTIMVQPTDLTPAETSSYDGAGLYDTAREHFDNVEGLVVGHAPDASDIAAAVDLARGADRVLLGTITANREQGDLVRAVAEVAPVVTAALRTPFDLQHYPEIGTHLCTYSVLEPSLNALMEVLAGGPASGRLPVDIDGMYQRGHGLAGSR